MKLQPCTPTAVIGAILLTMVAFASNIAVSSAAENPVLVEIGSDTITTADLDSILAGAHRTMDLERLAEEGALERILDKEIRDRLILLDATSIGLDQEDDVLRPVLKSRGQWAARLFLRDLLPSSVTADPDSVVAYFERYYRRVTARIVSLRKKEEAAAARESVLGGASMDSLARQYSLDTNRIRGGLIPARDWIDVDITQRKALRGLEAGEVSDLFANKEAWSFLRLESKEPADPSRFEQLRSSITDHLENELRKVQVRAVVDSLRHLHPIQIDSDVIASIREEGDRVLRGSFRRATSRPALWIDDDHMVLEGDLRITVAQAAMGNVSAPFDTLLAQGIRQSASDLVLSTAAEEEGYFQRPVIDQRFQSAYHKAIITAYLKEFVADKIRFRRDRIQEFYDQHQEDFRGPGQVRLSVLIYDTEDEARDVERRLNEGADFDYIRSTTQPGYESNSTATQKWAPLTSFSEDIRATVEGLEVGEHSPSLAMGTQGWMILRLDGRRPGEVAELSAVEMPIREQLYREQFAEILDDVLAKLSNAVGVVRHEDRIDQYFRPTP